VFTPLGDISPPACSQYFISLREEMRQPSREVWHVGSVSRGQCHEIAESKGKALVFCCLRNLGSNLVSMAITTQACVSLNISIFPPFRMLIISHSQCPPLVCDQPCVCIKDTVHWAPFRCGNWLV